VGRDCWPLFGRPACFVKSAYSHHYRAFLLHDLAKLLGDVPLAVRERKCYMHNGAPAHFSRAVRNVLNDTYHDLLIGRGGRTAWPPCSPDLNPLDFSLWKHLNTLVYAVPVDNEETLTIALWILVSLSAVTPATLNGCGGLWWDVSKRVLNLMEDTLRTYYKCALSAVHHKLNVSRHKLIWTFFLVLVCGIRAQRLFAPFSDILYNGQVDTLQREMYGW
jgi:hypothetical protein